MQWVKETWSHHANSTWALLAARWEAYNQQNFAHDIQVFKQFGTILSIRPHHSEQTYANTAFCFYDFASNSS